MVARPLILGLSASLRAARSKAGARSLADEIAALDDRAALDTYLGDQARIHLEQFVEAGRREGLAFDELYRRLQKLGGRRGLSNSEIALASALWGARQHGAAIAHIALADHFRADASEADLDILKAALTAADGIIIATPVYFGDRGSLSQRLIEMIRADQALQESLRGKLYAGISVGAKRNGGQETTLIYQMLDMLDLGLLGVGNDSDTTSQYGGTVHAGDIGTAPKDSYGIGTSIGTGKRIGRVAAELVAARDARLTDVPRLGLWVLQDAGGALSRLLAPALQSLENSAATKLVEPLAYRIRPCLACDICPTHIGPDAEYRCIIKRKDDGLGALHDALLEPDVIVPAVYSPKKRDGLVSVYQEFMERTRYLRRGDYVFTDRVVAPLVLAELGTAEHLDIRLMTSFIRHHTVLVKPIVGWFRDGRLLNPEDVSQGLARAVAEGRRLTAGRLVSACLKQTSTQYHPVGYVLAQAKDNEAASLTARERAVQERAGRQRAEAEARLGTLIDSRVAER
jgi:multimeric flavodoxin WrbA